MHSSLRSSASKPSSASLALYRFTTPTCQHDALKVMPAFTFHEPGSNGDGRRRGQRMIVLKGTVSGCQLDCFGFLDVTSHACGYNVQMSQPLCQSSGFCRMVPEQLQDLRLYLASLLPALSSKSSCAFQQV